VKPLERADTDAPDLEDVQPVAVDQVEQAIKFASPPVAAMMRLQLLTGMRPSEVCRMRVGDIIFPKQDGEPWIYRMLQHKTKHHDVSGDVYLGPKAQEAIRPLLRPDPNAYLFRPADALEWMRNRRREARLRDGTPDGQGNGPGTNLVAKRKRQTAECYDVATYRQGIEYACRRAFPLPEDLQPRQVPKTTGDEGETKRESSEAWKKRHQQAGTWAHVLAWWREHTFTPYRLRHTAATEIRRTHGAEAAQALLRHKSIKTTEGYAKVDTSKAMRIAGELG
jgi:integrase